MHHVLLAYNVSMSFVCVRMCIRLQIGANHGTGSQKLKHLSFHLIHQSVFSFYIYHMIYIFATCLHINNYELRVFRDGALVYKSINTYYFNVSHYQSIYRGLTPIPPPQPKMYTNCTLLLIQYL